MRTTCARAASVAPVSVVLAFLTTACLGAPEETETAGQSLALAGGADRALATDDAPEPEPAPSELDKALDPKSSVADAVSRACSTTVVWGLATQLVEEIECMTPGAMARIDDREGLVLGSAVFPFLQTAAAKALVAAQGARGKPMAINSGLRTLPQQYLLHRWAQAGRCGIAVAAKPGSSNHESGIAVDIQDNAGWRSAMTSKKFAWLGSSDPVHFDYAGPGTVEMGGLSVRAFQRLWNRNHPGDRIAEDGDYGSSTERRLAGSPIGGFAVGASCSTSEVTSR